MAAIVVDCPKAHVYEDVIHHIHLTSVHATKKHFLHHTFTEVCSFDDVDNVFYNVDMW